MCMYVTRLYVCMYTYVYTRMYTRMVIHIRMELSHMHGITSAMASALDKLEGLKTGHNS